MSSVHVPVLGPQILEWLHIHAGGVYLDGTLGGAGHTRMIAEQLAGTGQVISLDRDPLPVEQAPDQWRGTPIRAVHASYDQAAQVLTELGVEAVDGILLDLGLSSDQLADPDRGFSFSASGELDLRFDTTSGEPAWKLLSRLSEKHLADIIYQYGEERMSRPIARALVERRRQGPLRQADEVADVIRSVVRSLTRKSRGTGERIDPATRTFQALRIATNEELQILEHALRKLPDLLKPSGRIAIISFHSLEDRLVKQHFRSDERLTVLTRKPIRPDDTELDDNRRSRSSRLRVAERKSA